METIAGIIRLIVVFGVLSFIGYLISRIPKSRKIEVPERNDVETNNNPTAINRTSKKGYTIYMDNMNMAVTEFKIAGVTFKDGRASRQTALRMLKFQDPPMQDPIDFEFEDYEYDGKPAILIKANGRILGNVPADLVDEFISLRDKSSSMELGYKVSGGGDYSFGCKMVITWRF